MTLEAMRLAHTGSLVEAAALLHNAARLRADEVGYTGQRCGCGRFVARNELPCWEQYGLCSVCMADPST
jgi:hypothetical protein